MQFKKVAGAVGALAVAASTFAAFSITASAFDTVTINYEGDSAAVDWTSGNTGRYTAAIATDSSNSYMNIAAVGNGNNGTTVSTNDLYTAKVDEKTSFTMQFDMALTGGNNQQSAFRVKSADGNILQLNQTAANGATWTINGDSNLTIDLTKGSWYTFKITRVEADTAADDITYLTVTDSTGKAVLTQQVISSALSANGGVSGMSFETKRYYSALKIDNVTVRDIDDSADLPLTIQRKVTLNCVSSDDTDTILKSSSVYVDDGTSYTPTYDVTFDDDTYRYTYQSGADTQTITADTTYTLIYTKESLADHTISIKTSSDSDIDKVFISDTVKDAKSKKLNFPRYVVENGTAYQWQSDDYTHGYFVDFNNVTEDTVAEKTFTKFADNVAYFSEAEAIEGLTASSAGNADIRCSNGKGGTVSNDTTVTTLPAGKYKITAAVWGNSGAAFTFDAGSNTVASVSTTGSFNEVTSDEFTLDKNTAIVLKATDSSSSKVLDYVLITKTGEADTTTSETYVFDSMSLFDYQKNLSTVRVNATVDNAAVHQDFDLEKDDTLTDDGTGSIKFAVIVTNIVSGTTINSVTIQ